MQGSENGKSSAPPAAPATGGRWEWIAAGLLVAVAVVIVYLPALRGGFIWDDDAYVLHNPLLRSQEGLHDIWRIDFSEDSAPEVKTPQYYPMVFTTFWVEYQLWQDQPLGYRIVNLVLHLVNSVLVLQVARMLRIPAPWFVAAVFALHPLQVASIAWVAQRKNVLSGLFFLIALLTYLRFADKRSVLAYIVSLLAFIAALLSKSVTVTLVAVALLAVWRRKGRLQWADVLGLVPFAAVGVAVSLLVAAIERVHGAQALSMWNVDLWQRVLVQAPTALAFYAWKFIWPYPLVFIYPQWDLSSAGAWSYAALLSILLIGVVMLAMVRRWGWGPLQLLVGTIALFAPALGLVFFAYLLISPVADHFAYLGLIGLAALTTTLLSGIGRWIPAGTRGAAPVVVAPIVLLGLCGATYVRANEFKSPLSLWQITLERNPKAYPAMNYLGGYYVEQKQIVEATEMFRRASQDPLLPGEALTHLGNLLGQQRRFPEAVQAYRSAIERVPNDPRPLNNLAGILMVMGDTEGAEQALVKALKLKPAAMGYVNLARVFAARGDPVLQADALARAVEMDPDNAEYRVQFGIVLNELGRYEEAGKQHYAAIVKDQKNVEAQYGYIYANYQRGEYPPAFRRMSDALQIFPNDPRLISLYAWMLATCPNDVYRDGARAVQIAVEITKATPEDPYALSTLAAAYAAAGEFEKAIPVAENAGRLALQSNDRAMAQRMRDRIMLFRQNKPFLHTPE